MAAIWIIHRDERLRAALARLAGAGDDVLLGAPDDPRLPGSVAPRVVMLGVAGDLEAELEFAHRVAAGMPGARWLLVCAAEDRADVEQLFAALRPDLITFPPTAEELRGRLQQALRPRPAAGIAERRVRDALTDRFARWFADLELPVVLRALDPRLSAVPLVVTGESGTGRALLARYVHAFGGREETAWVGIPCAEEMESPGLLREIAEGIALAGARPSAVCLLDANRLPLPVQWKLQGWLEIGLPAAATPISPARWMATLSEDRGADRSLDSGLALALAGLAVRIPPLRDRPAAIGPLADSTVERWCASRGERPRSLSPEAHDALGAHLWPGNLRELEAVVTGSLAAEAEDPLPASSLHFDAALPPRSAQAPDAGEALPAQAPDAGEALPAQAPDAGEARLARADAAAAPSGEAPEEPRPGPAPVDAGRLVRSIAHAVGNPLVAIRTFASLLPERAEDPAFRNEFSRVVEADVRRLEGILQQLTAFGELPAGDPSEVDLAGLLEEQLEGHRAEIEHRRLLVLKELDRSRPHVRGAAQALRMAFELLLTQAFAWMPDRADVYLASRHRAGGPGGRVAQVTLRFHHPNARVGGADAAEAALALEETSLELALAELLIRAQGGTLTLESRTPDESILTVVLPTG
jgi:two-component system response regulator AtoC